MRPRRLLIVVALLLLPASAHAQLGCWVGMGSIQFGNVNPVGGGDTRSNGTMSLSCSGATQPYVRVCIALGAPVDMSWNPRYLVGQQTAKRLAWNFAVASCLIGVSLFGGMIGYRSTEDMNWIDAFVNASMILSGMGPLDQPKTYIGKLFAGLYALYSGLILILASGIVLAPVVHRLFHRFHLEEEKLG